MARVKPQSLAWQRRVTCYGTAAAVGHVLRPAASGTQGTLVMPAQSPSDACSSGHTGIGSDVDAAAVARVQASLVTAKLQLSDTCTFRILAKNVSVLSADDDPAKVAAFATLDGLISSYERLDGVLLQAGEVDSETRAQVVPLLDRTIELQAELRERLLALIAAPVTISRSA